jgi:hypothetical protein
MGAIALGFVLLLASGLWSTLFPPTRTWTVDKASRLSEIKARINDLGAQLYKAKGRTYGGADPGPIQAEYDVLTKEFDQLKTDFESTTGRTQKTATVLKWTGISLATLGIIGWYAVKQSS